MINMLHIRNYNNGTDRDQVIELWKSIFNYKSARNDPELSIDNKLKINDGLFLVAVKDNNIIGTIMGGHDGHRGWIYSLCVSPESRNKNIGTELLKKIEERLIENGCVKINLQIIPSNKGVKLFYEKNGYITEERIHMGKEISENIP
jgi:ribosomal protein S18 acetylase RimI-like enzyme